MIWIFLVAPFMLAAATTPAEPEYLNHLLASGNHEEFAKVMGIDVSFVRPSNESSEGSVMNLDSLMGDIMLLTQEQEEARQALRFDKYTGSRWPNDRIPILVNLNDYNQDQINIMYEAFNYFNSRVSNVKIKQRDNERDYVYIFSGNGCWSYLGRIGNQQALSLQRNGCVSRGTTLHEMVHAVGFTHEQKRSDRDHYIRVYYDNIRQDLHSEYNKVSNDDYVNQGPYDYYSIMHYGVWASGTGKRAFDLTWSGYDENRVGNGNYLTDTDVNKINRHYSK